MRLHRPHGHTQSSRRTAGKARGSDLPRQRRRSSLKATMPWIKFKGRFAYRPTKQSFQKFHPGDVLFATRALANAAMAAGVAVRTTRPNLPKENDDGICRHDEGHRTEDHDQ